MKPSFFELLKAVLILDQISIRSHSQVGNVSRIHSGVLVRLIDHLHRHNASEFSTFNKSGDKAITVDLIELVCAKRHAFHGVELATILKGLGLIDDFDRNDGIQVRRFEGRLINSAGVSTYFNSSFLHRRGVGHCSISFRWYGHTLETYRSEIPQHR